jgi:hypothetical protein
MGISELEVISAAQERLAEILERGKLRKSGFTLRDGIPNAATRPIHVQETLSKDLSEAQPMCMQWPSDSLNLVGG